MDPVEGHPIPQDITGFQFRIIGDMTIKQFAYLAGGAVLAWLFFSVHLPGIIKIPIAAGCALLGIILAFMPIHGRPADLMLMLFFKALFRANQFSYKKNFPVISSEPHSTDSGQAARVEESSSQNNIVEKDPSIRPAQRGSVGITTNDVSLQKTQNTTPQPNPPPPAPQPPPMSKIPVLPLDAVNLIAGVVEDPRGNVLPNIIVEVNDPQGSPVRAFKTNRMGQFIAATPVENGTYTVILEDPEKRHKFPTLTIVAKGEPLQPLEVKSMDQREQLRQTLFNPIELPPLQ